jgi:uncharacterized protein YigE (DUF2233 family)
MMARLRRGRTTIRWIALVLSAAAVALAITIVRAPDAAEGHAAIAAADRDAEDRPSAAPMPPADAPLADGVRCRAQRIRGADYRVCEIAPADVPRLRLMARDGRGAPVRTLARADSLVRARGERLLFATNAGLYHRPDSATGMLVADSGHTYSMLNDSPGPPDPCSQNFYCPPNGVFYVAAGRARVLTTADFARRSAARVQLATQSGPMLVRGGGIARAWTAGNPSRKVRNGVGVRADGTVVFAIADNGVNFHHFATAFRDELDCENALFLDGTISQLYSGPGSRMPPPVREFAAIFVVAG